MVRNFLPLCSFFLFLSFTKLSIYVGREVVLEHTFQKVLLPKKYQSGLIIQVAGVDVLLWLLQVWGPLGRRVCEVDCPPRKVDGTNCHI